MKRNVEDQSTLALPAPYLLDTHATDQIDKARLGSIVRRAIDIAVSVLALTLTAPLLLSVAALIFITMGRPVLFTQIRSGLGGAPFRIFKLRTMRTGIGGAAEHASDAARLTTLGRLLRSASIDELPGFVNVLRGEMSVVGPRPLLPEYLPLYSARQALRHSVRPGVTGWAQVNGRNLLSWQERLELDVWYVQHRSLRLDFEIIALTILRVIRRTGVSAPGSVTMTRFTGNPETGQD